MKRPYPFRLAGAALLFALQAPPSVPSNLEQSLPGKSAVPPSSALFPNRIFQVGTQSTSIAVGDFNGDGRRDLSVANVGRYDFQLGRYTGGSVSVLFGLGDGTFAPESALLAGSAPYRVLAEDLNADGGDDLVVTHSSSSDVSVLLSDGQGSFAPAVRYTMSDRAGAIAVGDFNRDGHPDLAVGTGGDDVSILLGTGDGSFAPPMPIAAGTGIVSAIVDDFNGDGNDDLAFANFPPPYPQTGTGSVSVVLGNGDGTFGAPMHSAAGLAPFDVAVGDLNRDGVRDLVVADYFGDAVLVLAGNGDGSFGPPRHLDFSVADLRSVRATDFDNDGNTDLAVAQRRLTLVLLGDGTGQFRESARVEMLFESASAMAAADFNDDGSMDLAVANNYFLRPGDLLVYFGKGDGTMITTTRTEVGADPGALTLGDFDSDGTQDLAVADGTSGGLSILLGRRDGSFAPRSRLDMGDGFVSSIAAANLNGDSRPDLVAVNSNTDRVHVFLGNGDGTFAPRPPFRSADLPSSVVVGEFDGDRRQDIAVLNRCASAYCDPGRISVFTDRGDGTFNLRAHLSAGFSPGSLAAGDLNGDGVTDLVVGSYLHIGVFLARGDGTFDSRFDPASPSPFSRPVALGDLNGDGHLDVVYLGSGIEAALGRGDGTFGPLRASPGSGFFLVVADFDLDGRQDVMAGGYPYFTIQLGDGTGAFGPPSSFLELVDYGGGGAAADVNGDSRQDLVITISGPRTVVYPNIGPFGDVDDDQINDFLDACVDSDGDGFGDPALAGKTCAADNCPGLANSSQNDADGDGIGDLCDPCPHDDATDPDRDGVCGALDNCPILENQDQRDTDGDRIGDACDNCPGIANEDQTDGNRDGSGDACQPVIVLSEIRDDGGETLEVLATARDPQDDRLFGTIGFHHFPQVQTLPDILSTDDVCGAGLPIGQGQAIGYAHIYGEGGFLLDMDSIGYNCGDGEKDFWFAAGACDSPEIDFGRTGGGLDLSGLDLPATICVARFPSIDGFMELTVIELNQSALKLSLVDEASAFEIPFSSGLPRQSELMALQPGTQYRLQIDVTDGSTVQVRAEGSFVYKGESSMVIPCPGDPAQDEDRDGVDAACDNCLMVPNPLQEDFDGDSAGDLCDGCTDTDGDGFGNPGFPLNACPGDNCPDAANSLQEDVDGDGLGDVCDLCAGDPLNDADGDGVCDGIDNCLGRSNADQRDTDKDGKGDVCDPCTDTDGDGVGDPGFQGCGFDNCPTVFNPAQENADSDSLGDACDPCPRDSTNDYDRDGVCQDVDNCPNTSNADQSDTDGDGKGNACDTCPRDPRNDQDRDSVCGDIDNCPEVSNSNQADADGDRTGDICDTCTDTDGDGLGNPGFPVNACPLDNCPGTANPLQDDLDGDGVGDVCDPCIQDPLNDPDRDAICGSIDNCPSRNNPLQRDRDGDGLGDACDELIPGALFPLRLFDAGVGPGSPVVGDFNRDGNLDLAVANVSSYDVSVLLGTGDGQLAPQTRFQVGPIPRAMVGGDLNADGHEDLVIVRWGNYWVSVFRNCLAPSLEGL